MAMVSHLHQLFNTETCQAYIHVLRWKYSGSPACSCIWGSQKHLCTTYLFDIQPCPGAVPIIPLINTASGGF